MHDDAPATLTEKVEPLVGVAVPTVQVPVHMPGVVVQTAELEAHRATEVATRMEESFI
jgi:hypothetical protein